MPKAISPVQAKSSLVGYLGEVKHYIPLSLTVAIPWNIINICLIDSRTNCSSYSNYEDLVHCKIKNDFPKDKLFVVVVMFEASQKENLSGIGLYTANVDSRG